MPQGPQQAMDCMHLSIGCLCARALLLLALSLHLLGLADAVRVSEQPHVHGEGQGCPAEFALYFLVVLDSSPMHGASWLVYCSRPLSTSFQHHLSNLAQHHGALRKMGCRGLYRR